MHKLFLVLNLLIAAACAVFTPWTGMIMWHRIEAFYATGRLVPKLLDCTGPILWGSCGPAVLIVAISMIKRSWNRPS